MRVLIVFLLLLIGELHAFGQYNLVSNSDFSNGLQSWSTQGNATFSSYFGVSSIAFSDANSAVDGVIYQDFLATKNELLTLNVEYSRRGTPIGRVGALIEVFDYIKLDTLLRDTLIAQTPGVFQTQTFYINATTNNLRIQLTDKTHGTIGRDFYLKNVQVIQAVPLALEKLNFYFIQNENVIEFEYLMPENCVFCDVEYSSDLVNWEKNGSNEVEKNILDEVLYYRLACKTIDNDFLYSEIQYLKFDEDKKQTFEFYPNPVQNFIMINTEYEKLEIYNTKGNQVLSNKNGLAKIELKTLEKGLYFLHIQSKGKKTTKRFFKT